MFIVTAPLLITLHLLHAPVVAITVEFCKLLVCWIKNIGHKVVTLVIEVVNMAFENLFYLASAVVDKVANQVAPHVFIIVA